MQVQDPRGRRDGQRALTTHLALHQPLEFALEQSAAEGDGKGHHRGQVFFHFAPAADREGRARQRRQAGADEPGRLVVKAKGFARPATRPVIAAAAVHGISLD